MVMNAPPPFRWRSTLGVSVALFLAWGVLWAAGLLGLPLLFVLFPGGFPPWLLFSPEADSALLGAAPDAIRAAQPAAAEVQWFMSHLVGVGVACGGVAITAIAWFALRRGDRWAFWSLVAAAIPMAILYPMAVGRYMRPGVPLGFFDLQPFVTIPSLLIPPAILLGWLGLRHERERHGSRLGVSDV